MQVRVRGHLIRRKTARPDGLSTWHYREHTGIMKRDIQPVKRLKSKKNELGFPSLTDTSRQHMIQLQRLRESRVAAAKMNEPPNQQVQSESCHVPRNKPLRDVDWPTQINLHWAALTASHRRYFLLSVHLIYVVTGWRPWEAIIQVHQRLNIFPCCSQVYKHVLPKRKAMMQSHQLVT